ncbi:MAG: hypothetical protein IKO44_00290 [Ruminococcus sp.]|nr:hypothetical protein [Ruminococcus sp.]
MRREEFISELKKKLGRLPAEELDDAVAYYDELFLDAGEENEEKTAASLGSIDAIARQIYIDNGIDPDGKAEFLMEEYVEPKRAEQEAPLPIQQQRVPVQQGPDVAKLLLLVMLFPIWFPLLIVCLVLMFVGVVVAFSLEIALISAGVGLVASGVVTLFDIPPLGIILIGAGLILSGIFVLTVVPLFRGLLRGARNTLNRMVGRAHNVLVGGR